MKSAPQSIRFRIAALAILTPAPIREATACLIGLWRRPMLRANISQVQGLLSHRWMPTRSTASCARPPRWISEIMGHARPHSPAKDLLRRDARARRSWHPDLLRRLPLLAFGRDQRRP